MPAARHTLGEQRSFDGAVRRLDGPVEGEVEGEVDGLQLRAQPRQIPGRQRREEAVADGGFCRSMRGMVRSPCAWRGGSAGPSQPLAAGSRAGDYL